MFVKKPLSPMILCGNAALSDCLNIKFGLAQKGNYKSTVQQLNSKNS